MTKLVSAALLSIALLSASAHGQGSKIAMWGDDRLDLGEQAHLIDLNHDIIGTGPSANRSAETVNRTAAPAIALTEVYRVGTGDVLDIQLKGMPTSKSTLYTVMEDGSLDYPFAGEAVKVAGLTTVEIADTLHQRIKIFENPVVAVCVRDYASHTLVINGFVATPGRKALRREATPLFVVLAEAQQLPEATQATIIRGGNKSQTVNLADKEGSATLVFPGDVINIGGAPVEQLFFFIGGKISSPGQKPYHAGLTLTQAILASGGVSTGAGNVVRLLRQGSDGRLVKSEYNLKEVFDGQLPDPPLEQGDRLEVSESGGQ